MKLFTKKSKGKTEEKKVPEQTDKLAKIKVNLAVVSRQAHEAFVDYVRKVDTARDLEGKIDVFTNSLNLALKSRLPKPKKAVKKKK